VGQRSARSGLLGALRGALLAAIRGVLRGALDGALQRLDAIMTRNIGW
jgi:hypothetical protein